MEGSSQKPVRSFRDLRVWQEAYRLAVLTYKICEDFPDHEKFGLTSQMTRSAVSVCSNIAEGFGRRSNKEKDQFYGMSNGSLTELENQILIAHGVGYLSEARYGQSMEQCSTVHKMLINLQKANRKKGERS